jgi:hypothetical protein
MVYCIYCEKEYKHINQHLKTKKHKKNYLKHFKITFKDLNENINEYGIITQIMKYIKYTPESHYNILIEKYKGLGNNNLYKKEELPEDFLIEYGEEIQWDYYIESGKKISNKVWEEHIDFIRDYEMMNCEICKTITYYEGQCEYTGDSYCKECINDHDYECKCRNGCPSNDECICGEC